MARIAVVTSSPPGVDGGHLVIARSLARALDEAGHHASLIITPDYGFGRNLATYWANWRTRPWQVGQPGQAGQAGQAGEVDQIISLRFPSYALGGAPHLSWLNHTAREYYDLWPRFSAGLSPLNRVKEHMRRAALHAADGWLLRHRVDRVVAQSATIQRRLQHDFGLAADVLRPPPPPRAYRCDGYGDFFLAISRLVPLKRIDLLVEALAQPVARHVKVAVAGEGESRAALEERAAQLGVADRIAFLGRLDEAALLDRLATCRAVCFPPLNEDYGFVTVEAFAASKAVVTCDDSGGPTELVTDGETGFITEPDPSAFALALARLMDDPALAERMGTAARRHVQGMTWQSAVERLVMV